MESVFRPEKVVKSGQYFYDFKTIREMAKQSQSKNEDFSIFDGNNKDLLNQVIQEISQKGVVPHMYYIALFDFLIFWYFFAVLFTTTFALLYYRKFKSV